MTLCNGTHCIDLKSDESACGSCGKICTQGILVLTEHVHVFPMKYPAMADALTQDLMLITVASAVFHVPHLQDNTATMEHALAQWAICSAKEPASIGALTTTIEANVGRFVPADRSAQKGTVIPTLM